MLVPNVQPVAMRSAVVCSFVMFVVEAIADHIMFVSVLNVWIVFISGGCSVSECDIL